MPTLEPGQYKVLVYLRLLIGEISLSSNDLVTTKYLYLVMILGRWVLLQVV